MLNQALANMVKLGCDLTTNVLRSGCVVNQIHLYGNSWSNLESVALQNGHILFTYFT